MIISRIQGGLGNQMFQYACGLSIAHANRVSLKLDIARQVKSRLYQLNAFNITAPIATSFDFLRAGIPSMSQTLPARIIRKIVRHFDEHRPMIARKLVFESHFTFIPKLFHVRDNCLLMGNWQSEKYFISIADTIRKEFTLKNGFGAEAERFARMMAEEKRGVPVSFHVRRGDTVSVERFANYHGSPDISYYRDAAALMRQKVGGVVFYIFSDDVPWVREHLLAELQPAVIVSSPAIKDAEDIILMSRCHHHIVAHSSFSWWGAWLNPRTDKIVIGPKRWYKQEVDTSDLTPPSWIRIENTLL